MAENNTKTQLQLLACPDCQGTGLIEGRDCLLCGGLGLVGWTGSTLLYWSKKIDARQIKQDKIKRLINNIINLLLFLFGAAGAVMLGWVFIKLFAARYPLWFFYNVRLWQLLFFWLTLLTDCYLFYRFARQEEKIKEIPRRKYEAMPEIIPEISWTEIKDLPPGKKIDILPYFTAEAEQALVKTWETAEKYNDLTANPIHLLIALLSFGKTQIIFSRLGISFSALKSRMAGVLGKEALRDGQPTVLGANVREIIFQAYFLAYQLRQKKVEITELLETLVAQDNDVKELLYDLNVPEDKLLNVTAWIRINNQLRENWRRFRRKAVLRPRGEINRAMTAIATPALDAFSQDLTLLAQFGYLMPCIGREKEFEEIFSIMSAGGRRSILLVGNPGVGKNTIIEGLAQKMVADDVPKFLQDKRLVSLSLAKLVSGADAIEAQSRLMMILNEIKRSGNVVLFVGDVHKIAGISAGREGSIELADVLSQALAKSGILCLATTTPGDYRRYIEEKSSLDRVMEKVSVAEVTGNEAIQILESKVNAIEYHQQVYFSYDAIAEVVKLASRYLHDRYLPEKAIQILQEVATRVRDKKGKNSLIASNDVAQIISEKTNIPLTEITKEESEKLLNLEAKIHERMIDQEEAVSMVATSLRRARAEMRDISRPIVNLLFLGPTGVGKTELAKTVAEVYFGDEKHMIRLDMSEYQDKSSLNLLIGAPPGYASSESGGYLTEAVRKNPFSLILLDEIEKAHPEILNIFLQVMDDGRLTDLSGRTIDFTNAIIIATSNAGTKLIQDRLKENLPLEQIKQELIDRELNQYFRPEFLNRFDGIIVFKPLAMADVQEIAKLMLNKIGKSLIDKGISLEVTPEAVADLAQEGFDPEFGARPLRRVIQQRVQDQLANYLLAGQVSRRDTVVIGAGGKISVVKARKL